MHDIIEINSKIIGVVPLFIYKTWCKKLGSVEYCRIIWVQVPNKKYSLFSEVIWPLCKMTAAVSSVLEIKKNKNKKKLLLWIVLI